jgi:hypothetical protein
MDMISLVISFIALLFSGYTFWFVTLKAGKLSCTNPNSFKLFSDTEKTIIQLPIVFSNTGSSPKIINKFRLVLENKEKIYELMYAARMQSISFSGDNKREMPLPIIVPANDSICYILEFQKRDDTIQFKKDIYNFKIEYSLGREEDVWLLMRQIVLDLTKSKEELNTNSLLAYEN